MRNKGIVWTVAGLWLLLALAAWVLPAQDLSVSERRPLAQMPELKAESLLNGTFMSDFEGYSLDQFPLRDTFRRFKSLFHYNILHQSDNNGIYIAEGMAVKQEYPLNTDSIDHAASRFQNIYDRYLQQSDVYFAIVPDKGYYLAEGSGHLSLDCRQMTQLLQQKLPWAQFVDLTDTLSAEDYYHTDTHWRQEHLLEAASKLCSAMGVQPPNPEDYEQVPLEQPFYGVYYGQAALPMDPETIYLMESDSLKDCTVYDFETGKIGEIYDRTKLTSKDLYDVYLSGAKSLLTIENPNAETDRELIIFRDSFGSAMAPLLVNGYAKVTLVDIRYLQSSMLPMYLDFHGQDVLFLYSTLVLNNSETIK